MNKAPFSEGDIIRFSVDGQKYKVDAVSPQSGGQPGERLYFIILYGRWPWQVMRTHLVPESAAKRLFLLAK